jgi:hypothetical protein
VKVSQHDVAGIYSAMKMNLKRFLLLSIWLCTFANGNAQTLGPDTNILYWTTNPILLFADFEGRPERSDTVSNQPPVKMLTHTLGAIVKSIDVHFVTTGRKTVFTIRAAMKKNASWIRNYNDTVSLKHEQGHFDICEIYARMLRRDIAKAKSLVAAKVVYEETLQKEEAEQDKYDTENTFQRGGITPGWKAAISSRLKALEEYQNPVVILPVDQ